MRMILSISFDMTADASAPQDRTSPPGLFRLGATPPGEGARWGKALLIAGLVHVGVAAACLLAPARAPEVKPREEPELVFFSFSPPPAAAAHVRTLKTVKPEQRARRPQQVRPPSDTLRMPTPVKAPPETLSEAPPEVESAPEPAELAAEESTGIESVAGVIGGVVGGALEGREGGLLGATGGQAVDLSQVARAPQVLRQVETLYPRRARAEGITGLVVVRLIIGVDGNVERENTRVLRSVPELDEAAVTAVNQWRFTPALGRQGRPVRVIVEIPIQFSLK